MQAKNVLYAAVGAPVVAARKVGDQVSTLRKRVTEETSSYTENAVKALEDWANEGEKLVARLGDGNVVEEFSSKVDLDQAKEQVEKLRDQLEDMLATWRSSFRPEKADSPAPKTTAAPVAKTTASPAKKPAAKTAAAKKTSAAKKPAAKSTAKKTTSSAKKPATKTSAAKTTKSSTAAKKSSTKKTASKANAS